MSVTEKSGNLRNDLRKVILESVSTLRIVFAHVMNVLEEKGKTINVLECEVKKIETERVSFMKELSVRVQPTPPVGQTHTPLSLPHSPPSQREGGEREIAGSNNV